MITNTREYRSTRVAARRFEEALAGVERTSTGRHPLLQKAMRESIESELGVLREQLTEYETLQGGQIQVLEVDSLAGLPDALVRARVASGLSQKALAERLGLKEQQIQRYEATRYAGAAFRRITEIVDALGIQVHERIVLPPILISDERLRTEPGAHRAMSDKSPAPQRS